MSSYLNAVVLHVHVHYDCEMKLVLCMLKRNTISGRKGQDDVMKYKQYSRNRDTCRKKFLGVF